MVQNFACQTQQKTESGKNFVKTIAGKIVEICPGWHCCGADSKEKKKDGRSSEVTR